MIPNKFQKDKKKLDNFIRYSSMAFEMVAIMGVGAFAGVKLDQWLDLSFPVFTVGLLLLAVVGAIYNAIRKFL